MTIRPAPLRLLLATGLLLTAGAAAQTLPPAAPDTIRLELSQAERQFVDHNFALMAR